MPMAPAQDTRRQCKDITGRETMTIRCAVLDDYQNVALSYADWPKISGEVDVKIFNEPFKSQADVHKALQGFQIVAMMRERTAFLRDTIEALPDLKLLITTGSGNKSIDLVAAKERGVVVCGTGTFGNPTTGIVFGLILELTRKIGFENARMKAGLPWQVTIGMDIEGKTLGTIGLGKLGRRVAGVAKAFGMNVLAWSPNLTPEKAAEAGVTYATKEDLLRNSDFLTIHVQLGDRSRGLLQAADLALMKPTSYLINTARGPIVNEKALIDALANKKIAGAGIDVYDVEPMALDHPFRKMDNVVCTPHLGYVSIDNYKCYYPDIVQNIRNYLDGKPVKLLAGY
jgi:phosphoglycerate dehydrogenase-like enzyme